MHELTSKDVWNAYLQFIALIGTSLTTEQRREAEHSTQIRLLRQLLKIE
jgi:hypothetical protein